MSELHLERDRQWKLAVFWINGQLAIRDAAAFKKYIDLCFQIEYSESKPGESNGYPT